MLKYFMFTVLSKLKCSISRPGNSWPVIVCTLPCARAQLWVPWPPYRNTIQKGSFTSSRAMMCYLSLSVPLFLPAFQPLSGKKEERRKKETSPTKVMELQRHETLVKINITLFFLIWVRENMNCIWCFIIVIIE